MELKNSTPTSSEKIGVPVTQYKAFHVKLPEILVEDLIALLNYGSLFAKHGRLVLDVNGPHSIRIRHTIMDDATFDDSEPFDKIISGCFKHEGTKYLDIMLTNLPIKLRTAIGSTIVEYLANQNS